MGISTINNIPGGIPASKQHSIYDLPRHLRPTLYYGSDLTQPVRCAGVLPFMRQNTGEIRVLLQCKKANGLFEDFGGSVDYTDINLTDTAARECHEESNGILDQTVVLPELSEDYCEYYKGGKFCLFFIEISPIHPSVFGDCEKHDGIERSCHWVGIDTVRLYNLHPRLRYSNWDTTLRQLTAQV